MELGESEGQRMKSTPSPLMFDYENFKYKALNTHIPTTYILLLTFYYTLSHIYPSNICIHPLALFLKYISQCTLYPKYLSISVTYFSSIFVYGFFKVKLKYNEIHKS